MFYKPPVHFVQFDACNQGSGMIFNQDWCYVDWQIDMPQVNSLHINCKEAISAVMAARRWAHLWANSKVVFCTDNMTARACIAKHWGEGDRVLRSTRSQAQARKQW